MARTTKPILNKKLVSPVFCTNNDNYRNKRGKTDLIKKQEVEKVDKGLTHIKYNKYAPSPEEAANMTSKEFRDTIYKRMKQAENER